MIKLNKNIEVISKCLWAVRFSLLQYIKEIDYEPDPEIPIEEEPLRISKEGILILNKDYKAYSLLREFFPKLMKRPRSELFKELERTASSKMESMKNCVYHIAITLEIQRRKELKIAR